MTSFLLVALLCFIGVAFADIRQDVIDYLDSVYTGTPAGTFASYPDQKLYAIYDNLLYYYEDAPVSPTWATTWPNGRVKSEPYAATWCDCLHIQLKKCLPRPTNKPRCTVFYPMSTYLNMDFAKNTTAIPANSWFEGITYPGEYGYPISCLPQNASLTSNVYGYYGSQWLYPATGLGYHFYSGKTAASYNKVSWLIEFGIGVQPELGTNKTTAMRAMAERLCPKSVNGPGFPTQSSCDICSDPGDLSLCCCHGYGLNLGVQVNNIMTKYSLSVDDALNKVADYYLTGMLGQESYSNYPVGTFFCMRDKLDSWIKNIQATVNYDSVQFTREPQHPRQADPAYAFEVLYRPNPVGYNWNSFCQSKTIGVVNPFEDDTTIDNYLKNLYVKTATPPQPLSAWKPRPKFDALFDMYKKRRASDEAFLREQRETSLWGDDAKPEL